MSLPTPTVPNSRRVPFDKRKRTETSCDKCKSRKQKCRKEPGQDSCRYCLLHKIECLTTQPRKKRLYGSVEGLGSRLALLESLVKGLLPEADVSSIEGMRQLGSSLGIPLPEFATEKPGESKNSNSTSETEESSNNLLPDQQGQVQYIGPGSSFSFHLKLRSLVGQGPVREFVLFGRNAADQEPIEGDADLALSSTPSAASNVDQNSPTDQRSSAGDLQGPDRLISAFFDHINPDFPVLHEASFREVYEQWDSESDRTDPVWLCTLLCMLLLARRVIEIPASEDQERLWWQRVQRLLPGVMFTSNVMAVQALMLAALHLHNNNHRDACWNLTGTAIRIAYAIGLHQDKVDTNTQTPITRELRKRTWWTLYAFEQMQVSSYDRPSAIEHNPGLKIGCPNERLIGMPGHCPPDYSEWFNRLVLLLGSACRAPKNTRTNASEESYVGPLSPAAGVLRELDRWKDSIPPHLKMDAVGTSPPAFSRSLLLLHAMYHYTVIVLCRSALLARATSLSKEGKDSTNSALTGMADSCIESGRALCRILLQLEALGKYDPITWWDTWYALSCGSVLVLDIVCGNSRMDEDVSEARVLLAQLADLSTRHRRNPNMPGTIDKFASIVPELHAMSTSASVQSPPPPPPPPPMASATKREEPPEISDTRQLLPQNHDPPYPLQQSATNSGAYMFVDNMAGRMYHEADYANAAGGTFVNRGFDRNTQMGFMDFSMNNMQDWSWGDIGSLLGHEGVPPNNGA